MVKHLVPLTSVSVSILMTAATGALPQHFLAIMKCGGWSSVSEDFEIRCEGVWFIRAIRGRDCQPGLGQESVQSSVLVLKPQQVLH